MKAAEKVLLRATRKADISSSTIARRTAAMLYQRLVLTLWLAIICCVGGWQDLGSVSRIQPYGRPFKLNSLRDSLPNTRPRARRESSRRRPRGKYEYNLKRTAIRDAKNRNALCLGKIDNLTNELCYCGGFRLVIFELRT